MRTMTTLATLLLSGFLFAACENDGPLENAGEEIDDAVEDTGDAIDDAGDEIEDDM